MTPEVTSPARIPYYSPTLHQARVLMSSSSANVFEIEDRLDRMFDVVYPVTPGLDRQRQCVPVLSLAIGCTVSDTTRSPLQNRTYFKIDFQDFLEYATSEIARPAVLSDFTNESICFCEAIANREGPMTVHAVLPSKSGKGGTAVSILDMNIARNGPMLSLMVSLAGLESISGSQANRLGQPIRANDGKIAEMGVTLILAPIKRGDGDIELNEFGEWSRVSWWSPTEMDQEWRFNISGELAESWLSDLGEGATPDQLLVYRKIRNKGKDNYTPWYDACFELARLAQQLPSYVDFMYDLVVQDQQKIVSRSKKASPKGKRRQVKQTFYRVIKSIRVLRQQSDSSESTRSWSPPDHSFCVHGHWRSLSNKHAVGKDANGNPILGKTWVRSHRKYEDKLDQSDVSVATRSPNITIGIKQTLAAARDVLAGAKNASSNESKTASQISNSNQASGAENRSPSVEWVAKERSKLSSGLRYLILKRDGFKCVRCGRSPATENMVKLEVDHKIPVSKWGLTIEENLESLCRECNQGKSNKQ